eukprot:3985426-Pyramimonas_sp.AAC.1
MIVSHLLHHRCDHRDDCVTPAAPSLGPSGGENNDAGGGAGMLETHFQGMDWLDVDFKLHPHEVVVIMGCAALAPRY